MIGTPKFSLMNLPIRYPISAAERETITISNPLRTNERLVKIPDHAPTINKDTTVRRMDGKSALEIERKKYGASGINPPRT
jgi:hypothetical protein